LALAAMMPTPGAAMSGLRMSLPSACTGPRDEKPATTGATVSSPEVLPCSNVTVAPGVRAAASAAG
jgi:hypothetical protein